MLAKPFFRTLALMLCIAGLVCTVTALETDCDTVYCFSTEDFSGDEPLTGICITGLPDASTGTVMLGSRVLRTGDILTADQVDQMTFHPLLTQQDQEAGQGQEEQHGIADQSLQGEDAGVLVLVIGILEEVEQKEAGHQRADQKQKEIAEGHFAYLLWGIVES